MKLSEPNSPWAVRPPRCGFSPTSPANAIRRALDAARLAQSRWAGAPLAARLQIIRRARHLIAEHGLRLAESSARCRQRPAVEALTAEVLPLAGACRFMEREAARLLAPRRLTRWTRPPWLTGVSAEVRREPFGVVLIIGPGNYPLLLPGVQLLQALAAGNAVLFKPAPGSAAPARALIGLLAQAGLDPDLIALLPDSVAAAQSALAVGVDKVVFTGSAAIGEKILAQLAPRLTPATMELSGCDAVFIRADADLKLVVKALAFGLGLNAGASCIGPRRVFVPRSLAAKLEGCLSRSPGGSRHDEAQTSGVESRAPLKSDAAKKLRPLLHEALARGARLLSGSLNPDGSVTLPFILAAVPPDVALLREDVFAPVLCVVTVNDDAEALAFNAACPYGLGASIFSRDTSAARAFAARIPAGGVVINDMIVPTADPRLPFGGRARSGFGVTRGAEGLLEMTTLKVVTCTRARWRPHLDPAAKGDANLFQAFLEVTYGSWRNRWPALRRLLHSVCRPTPPSLDEAARGTQPNRQLPDPPSTKGQP